MVSSSSPLQLRDVVKQISVFIRAGLITSQQSAPVDLTCAHTDTHTHTHSKTCEVDMHTRAHYHTLLTHLQNAHTVKQSSEVHPHTSLTDPTLSPCFFLSQPHLTTQPSAHTHTHTDTRLSSPFQPIHTH